MCVYNPQKSDSYIREKGREKQSVDTQVQTQVTSKANACLSNTYFT